MAMRLLSEFDRRVGLASRMMAGWTSAPAAARESPGARLDSELTDDQRLLSGSLMRVNHVGEICAQALYEAQALSTGSESLRKQFRQAAADEADHLAWTRQRLDELGARPSLLNPVWLAGSIAIGLVAGRLGDSASLGFMAETERQVERHLAGHLDRLPPEDYKSRAIVASMRLDEGAHADHAVALGGPQLPIWARLAMRLAARVMTSTARVI